MMKTTAQLQTDRSSRRSAAESNRPLREPNGSVILDNRSEAVAQRRLAEAIHTSPSMVAQRRQLRGLFGEAAQLKGGPEEEELLQGKFAPVQRQGPEDEEPLQGKFEVRQRKGLEEEEPLQGKFEGMSSAQLEEEVPKSNASTELSTGDTGLPDNLKSGIESLSGLSMDNVKVHYNSSQPARLNALAYTQGADIHVAPGQEQHLPHEAWHVVQQAQGRVQPRFQLKGEQINDDQRLEHEAEVMGTRAVQMQVGSMEGGGEFGGKWQLNFLAAQQSSLASQSVIQPKMGFELELPVLVDIDGRPVPEKRFLGRYGTQNLELQVDHNGDVEGPTPRPAAQANFWAATSLNAPGIIGGLNPGQIQQLGAYDLPVGWETQVDLDVGTAPAVDTRTGLPSTMLDAARWQQRTNRNRFARPPLVSDIGMNNAQLPILDQLIPEYDTEKKNWEPARAIAKLTPIIVAATAWLATNTTPPSKWHPQQRGRYNRGRAKIQTLLNEANVHLLFWQNPVNANPPVGMGRQYRQTGGGHAWRGHHPIAGQGKERYASILEIVTAPYQVETPAGLVDMIAAMTEADQLAAAIEVATNNFANRAQLNAIPNTDIANLLTHIGNDNPGQLRGPQSTDASIQSTFAVDLSQIPSLMKSTVAMMAPQQLFGLKHQADQMATINQPQTIYRAEREMMLAVADATHVINQVKGHIGAMPPSFVNLRGLVTLICQYLRLGRYWNPGGVQILDKNLTDLLSRTDLAHIFHDAVPAAEKTWLQASPANLAFLIGQILTRTNRTGATVLFNNPNENQAPGGAPHFQITCQTFINNVFTVANDGVTPHLGGFQRRPVEDIDPLNARPGDAIGTPHRMAPVFEMRNMMPKLAGDRFPRADWVPLATYMANMIRLLNSRTQAQATQDRPVQEHAGGPMAPTGFGLAQPPW